MRSFTLGAAAVALTLVGCAHSGECVKHGGESWRRVTSDHFDVVTNAPTERATLMVQRLEKTRAALLQVWGGAFQPRHRLSVIAFDSTDALTEFRPTAVGWFSPAGHDADERQIVISAEAIEDDRSYASGTLVHELAHFLTHEVMPHQPRWLAEGLAVYFETLAFTPDGRALVGRPAADAVDDFRNDGEFDLGKLSAWAENPTFIQPGARTARLYHLAGMWVHYLRNEHADRFMDYQARLAQRQEPAAAWADAFRGVSPEALSRGARAYAGRQKFSARRVTFQMPKVRVVETPMSNVEVHLTRAAVWWRSGEALEKRYTGAVRELDLALELDPSHREALMQRLQMEPVGELRVALARRLLATAPEWSETWTELAQSLPIGHSERLAAAQRAVELNPESYKALTALAQEQLERGKLDEAIATARRSVGIEPSRGGLRVLAVALLHARRCDEGAAFAAVLNEVWVDNARAACAAGR